AASMILTDDNFATIVKAVTNGRNVYTNIKNSIRFLLSGNTAGILAVLYTSIMGLAVPFAPVHLLFINLLTDSLPAIAIGMEPARKNLLHQPPRNPKEPILTKRLFGSVLFEGALIAVATMGGYYLGMSAGGATLAMTMAFSTLTLARLFHGFNCRGSESIFALGFRSNKYSLGAFFVGVALLAAVLFVPGLKHLFMVADSFTLLNAGTVALLAFCPTLIIQVKKVVSGILRK
ncbi:MAG: cation transporting ATPase C-terminal domain-containing protein, partial [Oscillospiraceae bacterium]